MKAGIHPTWYSDAKVTCACGASFTVGSTVPEIHVEVCSVCHPFYTGEAKYIDTMGRVERFQVRQKAAMPTAQKRKIEHEEEESPKTLQELMAEIKTQDLE